MTTVRQLFSLQELDLDLDRIGSQIRKAERELGQAPDFEPLESTVEGEGLRLPEIRQLHRAQELELEGNRERLTRLDEQLYGGAITSPRELESLQQEASSVRQQVESKDAEQLELSLQAEESQERLNNLQTELSEGRTTWDAKYAELTGKISGLSAEREDVTGKRLELAASLEPAAVQKYEGLRKAKGGLAVAKVERGLCQACRMSLPTKQAQQVRNGHQDVLCSTCGRILFVG
ncbi:MAG: hypothetical protein J4O03_02045 [Chloroflexi bacterium]|nr:hypothetical protein [Chloroflexota bacterium]MCI0780039.1 hypothetical protein [Chloroflexota bacterium]MCI0792222.1 hypothetical protein [Chloroflexota bacterium]MCI0798204.1 hypothetical protein [Chloroflexota bacterium]